MPRAQTSPSGKMVEFFRTVSMEVAEFALGQIQDILRERRARSKAAKERATKGVAAPAGKATTAAVKKPAKKKSHHKKKPPVASLLPPVVEDYADPGMADAGDVPELAGTGTGMSHR